MSHIVSICPVKLESCQKEAILRNVSSVGLRCSAAAVWLTGLILKISRQSAQHSEDTTWIKWPHFGMQG
jgi:hypothetical protein